MSNSAQPNHKSVPFQKSAYLFFGKALPVIVLFLITIIYSRSLTYNDYGTFQSVWMYINIVNVVISFGLSSVILSTNLTFFFSFVKKNKKRIGLFYLAVIISALIIFFLFSKNFNSQTKLLLIAFIIIQNIVIVAETLLIKQGGERKAFIINLFYSILFFGWHLYILFAGYSLVYLVTGISVISIVKLVVIQFIPVINENYELVTDDKKFAKHWSYVGVNDILGIISKWIDKIFLLYLLTPADFALFFNGSFEIPLFGLLVSVIGSVMLIEISKTISTKERVMHLFKESFRLLSVIVFPLFFFLLFFRTELFAVIFKNKYDPSIPIFLICIFILPIRINNYVTVLQYYQHGNKIMAGSVLDICIAIILMILLYPVLGTSGIALAIVLATYCQALYYLWQSAKVLHTDILSLIPVKALFRTFILMLLLYACLYYSLDRAAYILKIVVAIILTMLIILTGLYLHFSKKHSNTYGLTTKT